MQINDLKNPFTDHLMYINELSAHYVQLKKLYDSISDDDDRKISYRFLINALYDVIFDETRQFTSNLKDNEQRNETC